MSECPRSHLDVVIELDMLAVDAAWADAEKSPDDLQLMETAERLQSGEHVAYGVTTARVCKCCDQITETYVTALWGCVVETAGQEGRYGIAELGSIEDEYLRSVAVDMLAEAGLVLPCHCGEPVVYHDQDRWWLGWTRGLCRDCDAVRCDAYPGACRATE